MYSDETVDEDEIDWRKYHFSTQNKQPLGVRKRISDVWPELPSDDHLRIYVTLGVGSPPLLPGFGEYFMRLFVPTQNI